MGMKLKCHSKGRRCPPFNHTGVFRPNTENINRLLPDLKRCASCMASAAPKLPHFRDDLVQIGSVTLLEKGPTFDPKHPSGASFGTFIRPRICLSLTNAKRGELRQQSRERPMLIGGARGDPERETYVVPEPATPSFVDALLWDLSVADFNDAIPRLLNVLSEREQQVFKLIREDLRNSEIAERLHITQGRVSQLVRQVQTKLKRACQALGLIEEIT